MIPRAPRFESRHLLWGVCLAVLAAQAIVTVVNDWSLLRESRLVYRLSPQPYYPFLPVPIDKDTPPALGADFSQVYGSALAIRFHDRPYTPENPAFADRLGRRPNYPPFTNHVYVPLTLLPYRDALIVHTVAGLALLLALTVVVLGRFALWRHALGAAVAILLLVFQTPVGFSQLERGQFDLFVATAFLLLAGSAYVGPSALAFTVLGAILGALKWTSAPVLLGLAFAGFIAAGTRRRRLAYAAVPMILGFSALAFASELSDYWPSLAQYEWNAAPTGMSLELLLPGSLAKAVPIACTLFFGAYFWWRTRRDWDREQAWQAVAVPFGLSLALQSQCMFKIAYEYRTVALLGFLPVTVLWMERTTVVPPKLRMAVGALLGLFLVVAFRVFDFRGGLLSGRQMLYVFLLWSFAFLGVACTTLWKRPGPSESP